MLGDERLAAGFDGSARTDEAGIAGGNSVIDAGLGQGAGQDPEEAADQRPPGPEIAQERGMGHGAIVVAHGLPGFRRVEQGIERDPSSRRAQELHQLAELARVAVGQQVADEFAGIFRGRGRPVMRRAHIVVVEPDVFDREEVVRPSIARLAGRGARQDREDREGEFGMRADQPVDPGGDAPGDVGVATLRYQADIGDGLRRIGRHHVHVTPHN